MIYSLTGKITMLTENTVVVDTGTMAFEVICSSYTAYALAGKSEPQTILTYLQVREDAMCLYGFLNRQEKLIFNDLLLVSGVGPKMAITILSGMKLSDLIVAIINEDSNLLSKIKGLGKKTAERLCLELKDKVSTGGLPLFENNQISESYNENALNDAVDTLISLGINKNEAYRLARSKATADITAEEIILKVLRDLGR